jgi:hypothetical protein
LAASKELLYLCFFTITILSANGVANTREPHRIDNIKRIVFTK